MEENEGRRRSRLVLIPCPFHGHMTPMLQLATYLHSKGFSITIVYSDINKPDPSNHPDFIFVPLSDNSFGPGKFVSFLEFLQALQDNCKPRLEEQLMRIINTKKDDESVVIVQDYLMSYAGSVARDLGLPTITLRTSSAAFFPACKLIPQLHQQGRFPVQDSLMQEIVPELDPFRYKDLPCLRMPIQQALQMVTMIVPNSPPSAFIWNTLEFLESSALNQTRDHYHVPVFPIGPLHKITVTPSTSFLEEDTSFISWLDKQAPKSVIYVSIGSIATVDDKVLTEMAWGLANSNQPFLWVVRPGSARGFKWVEFLEDRLMAEVNERGLIIKWAPQKEVLAHNAVGGFWSHCGWNSTLESVSEGVPMLCQPFDADQLVNARYLSFVWKIGIEIVVDKAVIERAIRKLLASKEGEEMRQRATEIQEKVKLALNVGGSSHDSLNDLVDFIMLM